MTNPTILTARNTAAWRKRANAIAHAQRAVRAFDRASRPGQDNAASAA